MDTPEYCTLPAMFKSCAAAYGRNVALKYRKNGEFVTLTYSALYERALMVARGLAKTGVKTGDRVAILSENRAGWVIADMGILCCGAITVPIYPTGTPEQIGYLLRHSGTTLIFVSGRYQYSKLLRIRGALPDLSLVVSFERFLGDPLLPVTSFYQLSEIDSPVTTEEKEAIETGFDGTDPGGMATLIYTSGTTGHPKGVMLSHSNILSNLRHLTEQSRAVGENDTLLSFLPLSHVLERTAGYYLTLRNGATMAFADSIEKVPENMLEIRPTVMVCVPRLFEKIYHRIFESARMMPPLKRELFNRALAIGRGYVATVISKKNPTLSQKLKHAIADRLVFSRIRERFGGRMKLFCSGGAPLDRTINEFFWIIGIPVFEGYGLTETSPVLCFNNFEHIRFGSAGYPLPETEFLIADDGEILAKGPQVMLGYYNDPAATAEAMQDGWFRTGDIGYIEEGFLFITDRKKELLITSGGKNIAPQPIENILRMDRYIASALVCGDRRPYLTALIVPNFERLLELAKKERLHYYAFDDLITKEEIVKLYEERLAEINSRLAHYEGIRKFALLASDFSIEGGELTPTLKMKRKVIYEKYRRRIEDLYDDHQN